MKRPCRHGADACCPECPGHAATDGLGFPHPDEAERRGRRALQRCRRCRKLVGREQWVAAPARPFFGCARCSLRSKAKPEREASR